MPLNNLFDNTQFIFRVTDKIDAFYFDIFFLIYQLLDKIFEVFSCCI